MDAARRAFGANAPGGSARTPPAVPGAKNGVPDVSAFLNAVRADGSPDFASMARASGWIRRAFQAHAESLWSEMDAPAATPRRTALSKRRRATPRRRLRGRGRGGGDIRFEKKRKKLLRKTDRKAGPGTEKRRVGSSRRAARRFWRRRRLRGDATKTTRRRRRGDDFGVGVVAVWRARESLEELTPVPSALTNVGADAGRMDTRRKHKRRRRRAHPRRRLKSGALQRRRRARREGGASGPARRSGGPAEGIRRWRRWRRRRSAAAAGRDCVRRGGAPGRGRARAGGPRVPGGADRSSHAAGGIAGGRALFVRDPPGGGGYAGGARRRRAPPPPPPPRTRDGAEGAEGMSASLLTEIAGMGPGSLARLPSGAAALPAAKKKAPRERL